jgi:nucleoside-diphosphate-sugar epimerase
MAKKVLITGGMGFIGKVLVKKLLKDSDYDLVIVDNLSSSKVDPALLSNPRIEFIEADFTDWMPLAGEKYYQIYHLASPVGPVGVLKYKGKIAKMIIDHLVKVAEIALSMDAKLMEVSSSEVYGKHAESNSEGQREDIDKIVPANITVRLEYGVAKLLGEIALKNFSRGTNLRYNIVRPFNICGPSQNDELGFVIPRFLRQALHNEPITVYGDGSMMRTFTHVDDFVEGMYAVMEKGTPGEIYNLGNPKNVLSILDLAKKIKAATNSTSEITLIDPITLHGKDFAEAFNKIPNIDKVTAATGWKPKWIVDDIIAQLVGMKDDYLVAK